MRTTDLAQVNSTKRSRTWTNNYSKTAVFRSHSLRPKSWRITSREWVRVDWRGHWRSQNTSKVKFTTKIQMTRASTWACKYRIMQRRRVNEAMSQLIAMCHLMRGSMGEGIISKVLSRRIKDNNHSMVIIQMLSGIPIDEWSSSLTWADSLIEIIQTTAMARMRPRTIVGSKMETTRLKL